MRFFTYNGGHNYIIENQGQSVELTKDQVVELFKLISPTIVGTNKYDDYDFTTYMIPESDDSGDL